jgi:hypothetical protein
VDKVGCSYCQESQNFARNFASKGKNGMLLFHLELEFGFFKKNQFGPFFCEIFLL